MAMSANDFKNRFQSVVDAKLSHLIKSEYGRALNRLENDLEEAKKLSPKNMNNFFSVSACKNTAVHEHVFAELKKNGFSVELLYDEDGAYYHFNLM